MATQTVSSKSGQRRRVTRVRTDLHVAVALANGRKLPARVIDVSTGGMFLECGRGPEYGRPVTIVVQLDSRRDWALLPANVRWLTSSGCGVEFSTLTADQARALQEFVEAAA